MAGEGHHEPGEDTLSTTELHDVLISEDRRRVLHFFLERDKRMATADELANYLAAPDGGFEESEQAKVALHHAHLPKLADTGIIEYDPQSNRTRYRGHKKLEALLSFASEA
ncbi:DUF7344 domain-containing protein [Halomicrococcus sp. NG-SE-24]|uniref:DUF7344 domain-containing protein n=1 Tax=Halomicrococcus sp. NG-SE-24 TaxID=3436928 RepID=UPI003D98407B